MRAHRKRRRHAREQHFAPAARPQATSSPTGTAETATARRPAVRIRPRSRVRRAQRSASAAATRKIARAASPRPPAACGLDHAKKATTTTTPAMPRSPPDGRAGFRDNATRPERRRPRERRLDLPLRQAPMRRQPASSRASPASNAYSVHATAAGAKPFSWKSPNAKPASGGIEPNDQRGQAGGAGAAARTHERIDRGRDERAGDRLQRDERQR